MTETGAASAAVGSAAWWPGKRALVTGAAGGIGRAMAEAFAQRGAEVLLADLDGDAARSAAADLRAAGGRAEGVRLDVGDPASWEEVAGAQWSDGPVHVLCNNAGIGQGDYHAALQPGLVNTPIDLWDRVIRVNLSGIFYGVRTVVPRMVAAGVRGHVVNTSSMAGVLAPPDLGVYAASKFGVVALSEALRAELREHGIGVSVLLPGGVATAFTRRPAVAPAGGGPSAAEHVLMEPASVARRVVAAIEADDLHVFTHPEYRALVQERQERVLAGFGASAQDGYRDPERTLVRSRNPEYTRPDGVPVPTEEEVP